MKDGKNRKKAAPAKHNLLQVQLAVRDANLLDHAERMVMDAIVLRADVTKACDWSCFPSHRCLAEDTRLGEYTVQRAVRNLVKLGWIKRQMRGHSSNRYIVNSELIVELADARRTEKAAQRAEAMGDGGAVSPELETEAQDNEEGNWQ